METLKVSTRSNPNAVAGAMAGAVRTAGAVEVQVVGAGALNQAIKAVAIARGYVIASGIDLVCVPSFADIVIDGEQRTAIRLWIEDRSHPPVQSPALPADMGLSDEAYRSQRLEGEPVASAPATSPDPGARRPTLAR